MTLKVLLFVIPLLILASGTVMVSLGFSPETTLYTQQEIDRMGLEGGWFDVNGHACAYENGTAVSGGEDGYLVWIGVEGVWGRREWVNETSTLSLGFTVTQSEGVVKSTYFDISGQTVGYIALLTAIMAVATVAGIRVLDSGLSGVSIHVIIFGVALSGLWMLLVASSGNLILAIPTFGAPLLLGLSLCYTLGSIFVLSGSGGAD